MKNLSAVAFEELLMRLNAVDTCLDGREWARGKTLYNAYNTCQRADWMLSLAHRMAGTEGWPSRNDVILAGCDCAETALKYANRTPHYGVRDETARIAIETRRRYEDGNATEEELEKALSDASTEMAEMWAMVKCCAQDAAKEAETTTKVVTKWAKAAAQGASYRAALVDIDVRFAAEEMWETRGGTVKPTRKGMAMLAAMFAAKGTAQSAAVAAAWAIAWQKIIDETETKAWAATLQEEGRARTANAKWRSKLWRALTGDKYTVDRKVKTVLNTWSAVVETSSAEAMSAEELTKVATLDDAVVMKALATLLHRAKVSTTTRAQAVARVWVAHHAPADPWAKNEARILPGVVDKVLSDAHHKMCARIRKRFAVKWDKEKMV